MEEPGFWDDADRATKLVQEAKNLKDTVELYRGLEQQYEDIQVMIEMGYEEEDPSLIRRSRKCWMSSSAIWKNSVWRHCCQGNTTNTMPFCA